MRCEDPRAKLIVGDVLACLCAALSDAGCAVCCCQWVKSGFTRMPVSCDCDCPSGQGTAWVRIVERSFEKEPQRRQSGFSGKPCGTVFTETWEMEAGVSRCWPEGELGLTCEEMTDASAAGEGDAHVLSTAVVCCEPLQRWGIVPRRVRTLGPEGGCVASVLDFTVFPGPVPPPIGGGA